MQRFLEPEWLDSLPADAPEAVASRRDLRLVNWFMGNHRWLRREVRRHFQPSERLAEIGAGDGSLARTLTSSLSGLSKYAAFDLAAPPPGWPESWSWNQGDLLGPAGERLAEATIIIANLVLHHFSSDQLLELGRRFQHARLLLICEPARRQMHIWQGYGLCLLGINHVTRHDLPISVRAGFLGDELPVALGLSRETWRWSVRTTFLGAYRLVAERRMGA